MVENENRICYIYIHKSKKYNRGKTLWDTQ